MFLAFNISYFLKIEITNYQSQMCYFIRTYVKFKENIETESYIKYCMLRSRRSLLAQLRLGILPLHLEKGRFRSKKKLKIEYV